MVANITIDLGVMSYPVDIVNMPVRPMCGDGDVMPGISRESVAVICDCEQSHIHKN